MNPLVRLLTLTFPITVALAGANESRVQDFTLNDHTVYTVTVSATRVTTVSFPSPIAAIAPSAAAYASIGGTASPMHLWRCFRDTRMSSGVNENESGKV